MVDEKNITTAPAADLPPVPEMIMGAIETLNEETGSDKSTIQKQIESTYSPLPATFSDSLSTHLDEMRHKSQLLLVNEKFIKNPSSVVAEAAPPLRRGRGRPPKPKPALPTNYVAPPVRPRGRPPKARDPLAPPPPPLTAAVSGGGGGRKRGRPPKADKPPSMPKAVVVGANGERRGRGRPPKVRAPVVVPVGS